MTKWSVKIVHNVTLDGTEDMWVVSVRKQDDSVYKLERVFKTESDAKAYKCEIEAVNNSKCSVCGGPDTHIAHSNKL